MPILAYPYDVPERDPNPPNGAVVTALRPLDPEVITDLSGIGAATEPVREFDPVAYRAARRRIARRRFRRSLVKAFLVGVVAGVVGFSICVEVFT